MNLRERGVNWGTGFWFTFGMLQIIVGWGDAADMNRGLILIVMALVFAVETRIDYQIAELRYRLGELEYKSNSMSGAGAWAQEQ